jgi:hypothetical protein
MECVFIALPRVKRQATRKVRLHNAGMGFIRSANIVREPAHATAVWQGGSLIKMSLKNRFNYW